MKIAVLSDTHNNLAMVQLAQKKIRAAGVTVVIHCGDVIDPAVLEYFGEQQLLVAFGNGDYPPDIEERLSWLNPENRSGEILDLTIASKKIFVTHGHRPGALNKAIESRQYDYVFHGHTHWHRNEQIGSTRVVNPGALGGKKVEPRGFVMLDLTSGELEHVILE